MLCRAGSLPPVHALSTCIPMTEARSQSPRLGSDTGDAGKHLLAVSACRGQRLLSWGSTLLCFQCMQHIYISSKYRTDRTIFYTCAEVSTSVPTLCTGNIWIPVVSCTESWRRKSYSHPHQTLCNHCMLADRGRVSNSLCLQSTQYSPSRLLHIINNQS